MSIAALFAAPAAAAPTPFIDIHSAGPLSDIYIGNDLSCQVRSGGFSSTEFFPTAAGPGDCGTFFNTGSDTATTELLGPDFQNHAGGTHTTGNFPVGTGETPVTPVSQTVTGSGTASSPYQVTTVVTADDPFASGGTPIVFRITEVDTYVAGQNFYRTDITLTNVGTVNQIAQGTLYHVADCQLRGSDDGFGVAEPPSSPNTVACTTTVVNSAPLEEFVPITSGDNWIEATSPAIWSDLAAAFPNSCQPSCRVSSDNAMGIEWAVPGLAAGASQTFSFDTEIADTTAAGGFSFNSTTGSALGGTVATITDPDTSATASAYSASINWGDGTTSAGTITGSNGNFNVAGTHAYSAGGTYPVAVTITCVGTSQGSSTVTDSAAITSPPSPVITGAPSVTGPNGAAFLGSVNPDGLATTAYFQYGIPQSAQGPEGAGPTFTQFTPVQIVGSDFASHVVSASVSGLVPNELYDVQLVATNSAGTTYGPIETFTTTQNAPPPAPVLGKQVNVTLVSGHVWIKPPPGKSLGPAGDNAALSKGTGFVPLTEARQIPTGSQIDALHGSLRVVTATGKVGKTQTATLAGGLFNLTQVRKGINKGMTSFNLAENAFQGAPTYNTCKVKYKAGDATIAALSSKTLQLLKVSGHGKFRTTGRFAAATVRGTIWTISDRCDGTLVHAIRDTVLVQDLVRHTTILLHAGHSYLALGPLRRP